MEIILILTIIAVILAAGVVIVLNYLTKKSIIKEATPSVEYEPSGAFPAVEPLNTSGKARLHILSGPAKGQKMVIDKKEEIGKKPESIFLNDLHVSRRHAVLEWDEAQGSWFVRDLNSKNGTYLNNTKLVPQQPEPLPEVAELKFGHSRVRFVSGSQLANNNVESQEILPNVTVLATVSYGRDYSKKLSQLYHFNQKPIKGGFAFVFEGVHRQTGKKVGLKILPNYAYVRDNVRERFEREGSVTLTLKHPHIVEIDDWGKTGDGPIPGEALYILMEWIDGKTLRHRMQESLFYELRGIKRLNMIIKIIDSVCSALDYAHANGIIHRDIKPENIMFTKHDVVKVVDFGVANVANDSLTRQGTVIGTPSYMSPEQARGDPVDHRADIYATAAVTFELLTGRRLFEGDPFTVIDHQIHSPPPRPSSINLRLSAPVDQVLLRALDKDPNKRFNRAPHFARALFQVLSALKGDHHV